MGLNFLMGMPVEDLRDVSIAVFKVSLLVGGDHGHAPNTSGNLARDSASLCVPSVRSLCMTRTTTEPLVGLYRRFLHIIHVHYSCKHCLMCVINISDHTFGLSIRDGVTCGVPTIADGVTVSDVFCTKLTSCWLGYNFRNS